MATRASNPKETRLDSDVTQPSTTAPGDGPADTTDPTERASTVGGDKAAAAEAGHLTVNAVVPMPDMNVGIGAAESDAAGGGSKDRVERYPAVRPDGTKVTVEHNIDKGTTKLV